MAHAPLVAAGGVLYLVGGRVASGRATRSILRIDPATGRVSAGGRLPIPLADAAAVSSRGRVLVIGGDGVYAFRPAR
jgi:hypothetical protein